MSKVAVPLDFVRGPHEPALKAVYLTLWMKAGSGYEIQGLTKRQLGKILGFHEDKVSKNISRLNNVGLVVTTRQGRKGNKYSLPGKKNWTAAPGEFTLLNRRVFLNPRLPMPARLLHATTSSFSYKNNPAKLSHSFLATLTSFSVRTISRYMVLLCKIGLIKLVRRKYLCNVYFVSGEYKRYSYKPGRHAFLGEAHLGGNRHYSDKAGVKRSQLDDDIRFERAWEDAYKDYYV